MREIRPRRARAAAGAVILVDDADSRWNDEVEAVLHAHKYKIAHIKELPMAPFLLLSGGITALLLDGRKLGASDVMVLERCRKLAPDMAIVFVTADPSQADLKRALDDGATAVLSWPAPANTLLHAVRRGSVDVPK